MIATITKENLPEIREMLQRMVREAFPEVTFTDIWIRRSVSWYGTRSWISGPCTRGRVGQINQTVRGRLGVRIQDALWDRGLTASPVMRFITKSDVGDRVPVGFDLEDLGLEIATSWEWRVAERSPERRRGHHATARE